MQGWKMSKRNWVAAVVFGLMAGQSWAQDASWDSGYHWRADGAVSSQQGSARILSSHPTQSIPMRASGFRQDPESSSATVRLGDGLIGSGAEAFAQDGSQDVATDAARPLSRSYSLPPAPHARQSIPNQPGLSVFDMGDPGPQCDSPSWCNLGCERQLFGTAPNGLTIRGWSQMGYHSFDTLGFNDRQDHWNLHQQWFSLERQPNADRSWGYRADLLYGTDAQKTQAFGNPVTGTPTGWDNSWDHGSYGWALPQLYLSYRNCNWDWKLGKFFSPFGYEHIASPQNFFYSRSYARNFIEPFTMTGVLGERYVSDQRSIIVGATAGWDTGFDQNSSGLTGIFGTRSYFSENVSLASTASLGNTGHRGEGWMSSNVLQVYLSDSTTWVLQGDSLNLGTNQEFSIVNYLFHAFNPCLMAGARLEWWKSDQIFPDTRSTWSFTNGLNYRPHANLTIRPEVRVDWGAGALDPGEPIFGVDAILTF